MKSQRIYLRKKISERRWKDYELVKKIRDKKAVPSIFIDYTPYFEWDFEPSEHPQYCTHFGCGEILSQREAMFGDSCIRHQSEPSQATLIENYIPQ